MSTATTRHFARTRGFFAGGIPRALGLAALVAAGTAAPSARAKDIKSEDLAMPDVFKTLIDCRALKDDTARLACYDKRVAAIDAAAQSHDIVIADKAEIREARKGLFGFTLPKVKLFGGRDGDQEFSQIDTTIADARTDRYGAWLMTLEDGAVWFQIDTEALSESPRKGLRITIRQAALSSYKASIDGQPAIRVRRIK